MVNELIDKLNTREYCGIITIIITIIDSFYKKIILNCFQWLWHNVKLFLINLIDNIKMIYQTKQYILLRNIGLNPYRLENNVILESQKCVIVKKREGEKLLSSFPNAIIDIKKELEAINVKIKFLKK